MRRVTEQELQEEAERRVAVMSDEEKRAIWGFPEEVNVFLDYVMDVGSKNLTPKEYSRFRQLIVQHGYAMIPGGIQGGGLQHSLEENYGISWDDLRNGVKNPYKKSLLTFIIIGIITAVIAAGLGILGSRLDNDFLKGAAVVPATGQVVIASNCVATVQRIFRFRKLQKQCISGEMDEEMIRVKILKILFEERGKLWSRGNNTENP